MSEKGELLPDRRRAGWFDKQIGVGQVIWVVGLVFALGSLYNHFGDMQKRLDSMVVGEADMATKDEVAVLEERLRRWIDRMESEEGDMHDEHQELRELLFQVQLQVAVLEERLEGR